MKTISKVFFIGGMVTALTACGQQSAPAGNLAKDIHMDAGSLKNAGRDGGEDGETEVPGQEEPKGEERVFCFVYEKATLTPGELVDLTALPKYSDVAEVPSCAFGGNDKVYHFKAFELTTYFDEEEEHVYSVYFTDPNLPTTEGLCLGDTVDTMISLYGEGYETEENACVYTRGDTLLTILTKNDIVAGIEYRLDRE